MTSNNYLTSMYTDASNLDILDKKLDEVDRVSDDDIVIIRESIRKEIEYKNDDLRHYFPLKQVDKFFPYFIF